MPASYGRRDRDTARQRDCTSRRESNPIVPAPTKSTCSQDSAFEAESNLAAMSRDVPTSGEPSSMQEHWQSALSDMRTRLSAENFETWLAPIGWGGCEGHKLRLRIPNKFYADWIRTHYLDILIGLMRDKSGLRDIDVSWEVDEQLAEELTKQ